MKKQVWLFTGIVLFFIFGWYFSQNYKVFFSPFQILSHDTIQKNLQGICVDENRKLEKSELLSRAMDSYFKHKWDKGGFDNIGSGGWEEECEYNHSCKVMLLPKMSLDDYVFMPNPEKRELSDRNRKEGASYRFLDNLFFNNKNADVAFPGFHVVTSRKAYFYPKDCCNILQKENLSRFDYPMVNTPDFLEERGLGQYFLKMKFVTENTIFIQKIALTNCGNYLPEKYAQINNQFSTKEMYTSAGNAMAVNDIKRNKNLSTKECTEWETAMLPDGLAEKLYKEKFNEIPNKSYNEYLDVLYLYEKYYDTVWNGEKFLSCMKQA